ncbi:MAG: hypothetical protein IJ042_02270 [Butyricicoccus sp.]|nr:hypothetical protein [Butyricicoccus sp.]
MVYASRESVAYQRAEMPDLSRFDTRRSQLRAVENVPVKKKQTAQKKNRLVTPLRAAAVILMAALCLAMVYSHMQLTELTSEIGAREATLAELQSTTVSLTTKREETYSTAYIEDYAQNVLGMVKVDASQMEYIELSNPEKIEVTGTGASVSGAVGSLVRGFTAVLEYLR